MRYICEDAVTVSKSVPGMRLLKKSRSVPGYIPKEDVTLHLFEENTWIHNFSPSSLILLRTT